MIDMFSAATTSFFLSHQQCTMILFLHILTYTYYFNFWPHPKAYGILVPGLGIKPPPPALDGWVLTTGPEEVPILFLYPNHPNGWDVVPGSFIYICYD